MQYVWEKDDIHVGVYYHRGDIDKSKEYALSCLHKIGYASMHVPRVSNRGGDDEKTKLFLSVALTDGRATGSYTAEQLCKIINDGKYQPTTNNQLLEMLKNDS